MSHAFDAIYEGGVLRPLTDVAIPEHQLVHVVVETIAGDGDPTNGADDDPLAGMSVDMGIADLAENFDDYRLGRRQP